MPAVPQMPLQPPQRAAYLPVSADQAPTNQASPSSPGTAGLPARAAAHLLGTRSLCRVPGAASLTTYGRRSTRWLTLFS
jgi:hypothetical protein